MTKNLYCTLQILDEVNCRFDGLRQEHIDVLNEKFAIMVDGAQHMPAVQLRRWDGKIRFFEKNGKTFTKILDEILPYVCSWGYEVDLVDKRQPAPIITDRIDENFFNLETFKLRPYQVEVVNSLLEEGSGFCVMGTGGGKTSVCAALSMVLYQNGLQTLIIVPSTDLVNQTIEEFQHHLVNHSVTIGEYSGSQKDIDHPIVVATWQSLQNVPHYMKSFQAFIVDECVHPNTLIETGKGNQKISSLKPGDFVMTLNEITKQKELKPIKKVYRNLSTERRLRIKTDDGREIIITSNHKILTQNGWKRADELKKGDQVL